MSRFDYIKYDEKAIADQERCKSSFESMEKLIELSVKCPRSKALIHTKLEEAYMWLGKAIRNDQIERNRTVSLQEQRTN